MKKFVYITQLFLLFSITTGFYGKSSMGKIVRWRINTVNVFFCENMKIIKKTTLTKTFKKWEAKIKNKIKFKFHWKTKPYWMRGIGVCFDPIWKRSAEKDTYALTDLYWSAYTGNVRDADIFFNASFYRWTKKGNGKRYVKFEGILLHEIGHALGLRHSNNRSTVMYARPRRLTNRSCLHRQDVRNIKKLYRFK